MRWSPAAAALVVASLLIPGVLANGLGWTQAPGAGEAGPAAAGGARVLLVLPFDNRTAQPSLEWIREAAAEILSTRFASAGFEPTSREDRIYALDHLGLPQGFQPSR